MNTEIYLDANATSPVLPAAIQAAQGALLACFGNPSSSHAAGLRARALLDDARSRARRVLGAPDGRLLFTSGATEGIQTAVISSLCAVRERRAAGQPCGDLLLYGATEHKAVPESLAHWNALLGTGLKLQALARFLDRHPDALLVDVREACAHALGTPLLHGRAAYSLPLSRLPDHAAWLCRETRPLVFFCRSGKRSAQAAQIAQQLGHGNVRHLAGGLALLAP